MMVTSTTFLPRRTPEENGLTVLEVIIVLVVLGFALAVTVPMLKRNLDQRARQASRAIVPAIAAGDVEKVRFALNQGAFIDLLIIDTSFSEGAGFFEVWERKPRADHLQWHGNEKFFGPRYPFRRDLLSHAVALGHTDVARLLLRYGADPNGVKRPEDKGSGRPPLYFAAARQDRELLDLLLGAGADPDAELYGKTTEEWLEHDGEEAGVRFFRGDMQSAEVDAPFWEGRTVSSAVTTVASYAGVQHGMTYEEVVSMLGPGEYVGRRGIAHVFRWATNRGHCELVFTNEGRLVDHRLAIRAIRAPTMTGPP